MTLKQILKIPIVKQLMGATVGGTLALGIYYAYEAGTPMVTAWLTVPQISSEAELGAVNREDDDDWRTTRARLRTERVVSQHGQVVEEEPEVVPEPAGWDLADTEEDNVWDDWSATADEATEDELQAAAPLDSLNDDIGYDSGWDDWAAPAEWDAPVAPLASITNPGPGVTTPTHATPTALPDSGVGVWVILLVAALGTCLRKLVVWQRA